MSKNTSFNFGNLQVGGNPITVSARKKSTSGFDFGGLQTYAQSELKRREEDKIKEAQRKIEEQQKNVEEFNKRQEELASSSKFKQFGALLKKQMGEADVLPEVQGASNRYNSARNTQIAENAYMDENAGRIAGFFSDLVGKAKNAIKGRQQKQAEYTKSLEYSGMSPEEVTDKLTLETAKGVAKNVGELASGAAKFVSGMNPFGGYSSVRKVLSVVGGQKVERFIDRNTPEYIKSIDGFVDKNGILNYHPRYETIAQQTGGEVSEIGSWFIPITRSARVEKLLAEIPTFSKLLNVSPKLVKFGEQGAIKSAGKFALELSKDVVDVATLDALRGKSAEDILDDVKMAGAGSFTIRLVGKPIGYIFNKAKEGKTVANIESSGLGKLSSEEVSAVRSMIKEGKTTDEIQSRIADERGFFEPSVSDTPILNSVSREWEDVIDKNTQKQSVYDSYVRPQLDGIKEPKVGEVVIYRSSNERGSTVETDPVKALSGKIDENFKIEIVPESSLKSTGDDVLDASGTRIVTTGEPKVVVNNNDATDGTIDKKIEETTPESTLLQESRKYNSAEEFVKRVKEIGMRDFSPPNAPPRPKLPEAGISGRSESLIESAQTRLDDATQELQRIKSQTKWKSSQPTRLADAEKSVKFWSDRKNALEADLSRYKAESKTFSDFHANYTVEKKLKDAVSKGTITQEEANILSQIDKEKITNPSQLTDLYNKAHGGAPKETSKPKSVTAQKMNKILGTDFEEGYGVRGINKELESAADLIEKNEKKAVQEAFAEGGDTVRQVALLAEMLGKSKGMSKEIQADIFMRIKELSTQTGQTMNIFKALTETNPHWMFMNRLIDIRLGSVMKNWKWNEFRQHMKANKRAELFSKETESVKKSLRKVSNGSFKVKDAQAVLKSLMCNY